MAFVSRSSVSRASASERPSPSSCAAVASARYSRFLIGCRHDRECRPAEKWRLDHISRRAQDVDGGCRFSRRCSGSSGPSDALYASLAVTLIGLLAWVVSVTVVIARRSSNAAAALRAALS
jgi:hypothetical protein